MSDNPFGNNEGEKTILIRPTPGGRPAAVPRGANQLPAEPQPTAVCPYAEPAGPTVTGQSALLVATTPLLQLLGRLRTTVNPPDPATLRTRALDAIRTFEAAGRASGVAQEVLHPARYALCASVDDAVMHTPWGSDSPWVRASLVSTLHKEVIAGEGFFHQLEALKREPARNLDLLELMYICLSLGYQGQYRLLRNGPAQLDQLREDLYQTIARLRSLYDPGLSPRWQGVEASYRPGRAVVPIWVMAAVMLAVVSSGWLAARYWSSDAATRSFRLAFNLPPEHMPLLERSPLVGGPPPPPPCCPPPPVDPVKAKITTLLAREIADGYVSVSSSPQSLQITIFRDGLFTSGSAVVRKDYLRVLSQIGEILAGQPGSLMVTGHTDNRPIHNAQFPSNLELSLARAKAAAAILMQTLQDARPINVRGLGESRPIQDNDTEARRAENRRVEITLQRED